MGYNLTIGNVEIEKLICEDGEYHVPLFVPHIERDDAPRDGSPTDGTNRRCPSYTGWSNFCDETGLRPLFFDENDGLIRRHPGVFELKPRHLAQISAAHARLKTGDAFIYSVQRGRMEWLEYWVEWALENCERPSIGNT